MGVGEGSVIALSAIHEQCQKCTHELKRWTQSKNRWMHRAAAVSLIVPAKHGRFQKESLEIAALLLTDTDDIVQKQHNRKTTCDFYLCPSKVNFD